MRLFHCTWKAVLGRRLASPICAFHLGISLGRRVRLGISMVSIKNCGLVMFTPIEFVPQPHRGQLDYQHLTPIGVTRFRCSVGPMVLLFRKTLTAPLVGGGFIVPVADASALRIVDILLGGVKPAALVSRAPPALAGVLQKITCSSRGVGSVMWSGLPQRMTV